MALSPRLRKRIALLKKTYDEVRRAHVHQHSTYEQWLAEYVYESNAIEHSPLSLKDTARILRDPGLVRRNPKHVLEAVNLAQVVRKIDSLNQAVGITEERMCALHETLLGTIDARIAGRFRSSGEYVRIGQYVAPAPELVQPAIAAACIAYTSTVHESFVDAIARFHAEFETIHPFVDGNGRTGRAVLAYQLIQLGYPPIIIRVKEREQYFSAIAAYQKHKDTVAMERLIALYLIESLHRGIADASNAAVIPLVSYAKRHSRSVSGLLNAALRQSIPAFRKQGVWMISSDTILI